MVTDIDFDSRETQKALEKAFGCYVYHWPYIPPRKPGFLDFKLKRQERRINEALATIGRGPITEPMRIAFWHQVKEGQGFTDAGGYCWRCWQAALGLPYIPANAWHFI